MTTTAKGFRWLLIIGMILLVLGLASNLWAPLFWGWSGNWEYNTCPGCDMGGMMRGWRGPGTMAYFGWLGMRFGLLFPLGLLVLLVAGGVWLLQAITSNQMSRSTAQTSPTCPHCDKPIQPEWRICPFCETSLMPV